MKIVDYKVVRSIMGEEFFMQKVKEYLRDGWIPQGGVSHMRLPVSEEVSYVQAFIKVEKE